MWVIFLVVVVVCFVLYGIVYQNKLQKKLSQKVEVKNELEPVYKELLTEKKEEYTDYLSSPEYEIGDFPVVTTEKNILLYYGNMDSHVSYNQKFDIWKNDKNLCCMTNSGSILSYIKEVYHNQTKSSYLADQKEDYFRYLVRVEQKNNWEIHAFSIPIDGIEYFAISGQKYATTEVTGGGGTVGGSSLTGAVAGGIIAGGAGAVIGSRKETTIDPIKSQTKIHDERTSYIKYKKTDGTLDEIVCTKNADAFFDTLKKVIPEKEYAYILSHPSVQGEPENNNIEERLTKAKELFDKGLITQEEYEKKRESILEDM